MKQAEADNRERRIVTGVNRKDTEAWKELYSSHYSALCVYVSRLLNDEDGVEDLVQEVFIAVWEGSRLFSDYRELTNYLYRACYNNTLLYIRNNQLHHSLLDAFSKEHGEEDEDAIYALTLKEEAIRRLYCHIEELPREQRRIILLRIEGHSWEEIADRLGVSINTVKTQKSRSYKFLRERLGDAVLPSLLLLASLF